MIYVIRRAGMKDAARLAHIGGASFLEAYANLLPPDEILAFCRTHHVAPAWEAVMQNGAAAWIAEDKDRGMVGYALLTAPNLPGQGAGDAELRRIYTLRRTYGSGLGKALLEVAETQARSSYASRLVLGVYGRNARAIAFYRKQGFVPIGTRVFQVGTLGCDDLVLAKNLAT